MIDSDDDDFKPASARSQGLGRRGNDAAKKHPASPLPAAPATKKRHIVIAGHRALAPLQLRDDNQQPLAVKTDRLRMLFCGRQASVCPPTAGRVSQATTKHTSNALRDVLPRLGCNSSSEATPSCAEQRQQRQDLPEQRQQRQDFAEQRQQRQDFVDQRQQRQVFATTACSPQQDDVVEVINLPEDCTQGDGAHPSDSGRGRHTCVDDRASVPSARSHEPPPSHDPCPLDCWLASRGLAKYVEHFRKAGADLDLMPCLKDADLQQMGIAALGARKKVLLGAAELAAARLPSRLGQTSTGKAADFTSLAATHGIASYFIAPQREPGSNPAAPAAAGGGAGPILRFLQLRPDGQRPGAAPAGAAPRRLAASIAQHSKGGGKRLWAHQAAAARGGGRWGAPAAAPFPFKSWHLIPGTGFVVDRFYNLPPTPPHQRHWFLTHFHADHYQGLTSRFDRGTIYCTPVTAALVHQQLRVPASRLAEVALGGSIVVEGVRVTFLDANHCPGAAMLLFEPPGRRAVLHTGDCRLTAAARGAAALERVRGNVDLILDTTYCDPQYDFPPQPEVLQFAIDAVKAEAFNPKTLFLFGSYTIGKERLYLEAARALERKVYVSATKKKVLDCLGLAPEHAALLTTDDTETNLHAVPLWMVSQKHMANTLRHYRGRFSNVVGFQPTGWTHEKDAAASRQRGRRCQKGTLITYRVPYSEHSSFAELRNFVAWLRPTSILPHVNNDGGGPKAQRMVALLRGQDC